MYKMYGEGAIALGFPDYNQKVREYHRRKRSGYVLAHAPLYIIFVHEVVLFAVLAYTVYKWEVNLLFITLSLFIYAMSSADLDKFAKKVRREFVGFNDFSEGSPLDKRLEKYLDEGDRQAIIDLIPRCNNLTVEIDALYVDGKFDRVLCVYTSDIHGGYKVFKAPVEQYLDDLKKQETNKILSWRR